mmetsp:Transcript_43504/g.41967  ORF Transcript_43504/g.41967 Transcript_43504/m.41967 type:complete len:189 (+) Transcript_43504:235-801(+)
MSEYNLYLCDDINNDNSLTQWFYFSMRNIKVNTVVKLNIMNLMKDGSLYSSGMKPFIYSLKKNREHGVAWHRGAYNIIYNNNGQTIRTSSKTLDHEFDPTYVDYIGDKFKQTSTLSFTYEFEYDNDIVFFAHFVPFTYSDLKSYLNLKFSNFEKVKDIARIDGLAHTVNDNLCYCITISNNLESTYMS